MSRWVPTEDDEDGDWTLLADDGSDVATLYDDELATFPALVQAERERDELRARLAEAEALLNDNSLTDALSHQAWDDWHERRDAFLAGGKS